MWPFKNKNEELSDEPDTRTYYIITDSKRNKSNFTEPDIALKEMREFIKTSKDKSTVSMAWYDGPNEIYDIIAVIFSKEELTTYENPGYGFNIFDGCIAVSDKSYVYGTSNGKTIYKNLKKAYKGE